MRYGRPSWRATGRRCSGERRPGRRDEDQGAVPGRAAASTGGGDPEKRPRRRRPTRSTRGRRRRGKLASGVGVGQRPPDAGGSGGTEPLTRDFAALPAGRRTEQTEREARSPGVRPPAADSNTDGWRARPISSRPWRSARGASGQWEAAPAVALPGLGARWVRRASDVLPDLGSPSGLTGDGCGPRRRPEVSGSAADVTGLSGKGGGLSRSPGSQFTQL